MAGQFALDVSRWVEKAGDRGDLVVRKVCIEMFSRVILKSPVDTGRFRGNWLCTIGSPASGASEDKKDKPGDATVAAATSVAGGAKAGDTVFLTNNLPYALRLENGHSKQAPVGMVGVTVREFQAVVSKATAESKAERP